MGIKKYNLKPKKLRKVSSPGALLSALDEKLNNKAGVNVAFLEYDFATQGGEEGSYDLTSKMQNLWKIGDFIICAGFVCTTAVTAVGSTIAFGNTEDSGAFTTISGSQIAGAKDGWFSNGSIEQYVLNTTRADFLMDISGAPALSGKVKIAIVYISL